MKSKMIKEIGFRAEYSGAQDYDLVLRAAGAILDCKKGSVTNGKVTDEEAVGLQNIQLEVPSQIAHIPKVLYHWRCHTGSTAENPQSKQYAYEAGRRALQDFADRMGWEAKAVHLKHLGFYALEYPKGIFESRKDIGAVGGSVIGKRSKKIIGGRMSEEGELYYDGLPIYYSGYLHRAVLTQDAEAVDIRCMQVRLECRELFAQTFGVPYQEKKSSVSGQPIFDASVLPKEADDRELSLRWCKVLQEAGYRILYLPNLRNEN